MQNYFGKEVDNLRSIQSAILSERKAKELEQIHGRSINTMMNALGVAHIDSTDKLVKQIRKDFKRVGLMQYYDSQVKHRLSSNQIVCKAVNHFIIELNKDLKVFQEDYSHKIDVTSISKPFFSLVHLNIIRNSIIEVYTVHIKTLITYLINLLKDFKDIDARMNVKLKPIPVWRVIISYFIQLVDTLYQNNDLYQIFILGAILITVIDIILDLI